MGTERRDGSVLSANTPEFRRQAKTRVDRDTGIYRCMVTRVFFVDDDQNLTFGNKQVTYEVVIIGGPKEGQIIPNVKALREYGGEFNYSEKVYRPIDVKNLKDKNLSEHKGDIVYVAFLQGSTKAPVILGAGIHPLDVTSGATKAKGFRDLREWNGVLEEVNKSGEYELVRKGGKLDETSGVFTPGKEFEARFKLFQGKMLWEDPNSSITFDKEAESLTFSVGKGSITQTLDGKAKAFKQKVGNVTVDIDGESNKVTIKAGEAILEIDGSSGKISLKSDMIDLGKSVSDFATLFTELASAFAIHTHMAPQAPSGTLPTTPPIAPLLPTVGSMSVKVQP